MPHFMQSAGHPTRDARWLLAQWEMMTRIRLAEEAIADMAESGEARCPCHLYIGQEAVATGVCSVLVPEDTIWGGHRSHGHYLAKGGSLEALFAEILGQETGCARGRGGSMHLIDDAVGILGTVPIVAGTVPLAAGAALASKMRGDPHIAVAFLGDGAVEEGHVHETLNLAALYRLPLLFICENNFYSSHMHWSERRVADNLDRAGEFHSVPGMRVDGNDVEAVHDAVHAAASRARQGQGPTWIECRTFRWRGHVGPSHDLDVGVKRRDEIAEWISRDPIARAANKLESNGVTGLRERQMRLREEVHHALTSARQAASRPSRRLLESVWCAEPQDPRAQEATSLQ